MSKRFYKSFSALVSRFKGNIDGNIAIMFGMAAIPLTMAVGSAVDYSRAVLKQRELIAAVDTAVLAGGIFNKGTQAEFKLKVEATLYANFPQAEISYLDFVPDPDDPATITVTARSNVPTTIANVWNVSNIPIEAHAKASPTRNWAEIALVLDNTSSMAQNNKMKSLKLAASSLIETLHATATNPEKLLIGIVPFAATVRLSDDLLTWSGIDKYGDSSISGEDFVPGSTNVLDLYDDMSKYSWGGCVRARAEPYDVQDTPAIAGDTLFPPFLAPDEPDLTKTTGKGWKKKTTYLYSNRYLNDNSTPGGNNADTRQRNVVKYSTVNAKVSSSIGPERYCPEQPILNLSSSEQNVLDAIDGMEPWGYTIIPTGLAWGWRMLSPGAPYNARAYDPLNKKFIILLTDGENSIAATKNEHNKSSYGSYGYAREGHMGATNGSTVTSTLDAKTATLCANAKAEGITIFTITFALGDGDTQDLFRACATSPEMYYNSPNNDALNAAFAQIAGELSKLRLTQ